MGHRIDGKKHERYTSAVHHRGPSECSSVLFGRSDHSTERAEKSRNSVRSGRLVSHSYGAFLYTQPFPGAEVRSRLLSTAHLRRGPDSAISELPRIERATISN